MSEIKNPIANLDPKAIDQMVETFTAMGKAMRDAVEELAKEREWNHPTEDEPDSFVAPFQSKGTHVMGLDGSIEEVKPLTNEEDVARQNDYEVDKHGIPLDWNLAMSMLRTAPIQHYLTTRRDHKESEVVKEMFEKQATNWGAELRTMYGLLDCVENNKGIDALKQLLAERDSLLKRLDYATQLKDETLQVNAKLSDENIAVQQKAIRLENAWDTAKADLANVKKANEELREANKELAKANNHQADELRGQAEVLRLTTQRADNASSELAKMRERVEDLRAMLPSGHPQSTRPKAVDEQYNKRVIKDAPQA